MQIRSLMSALSLTAAAPASEWRNRVIYQVITDRFETDKGGVPTCPANLGEGLCVLDDQRVQVGACYNGRDIAGIQCLTPENFADYTCPEGLTKCQFDDVSNCTSLFRKENQCTYGDFCGGTFQGLVSKLDDIQAMGFDAIWISPVVANVMCGYTGYWAKDLYEIAEEHGGEEGLKQLVEEAHRRDIFVMVDVVYNHMGHTAIDAGCYESNFSSDKAFDGYRPFNSLQDYHDWTNNVNWRNWTSVEDWWLFCLPDVDTEDPWVIQRYLDWTNHLINDFGIDGLRIDTIPYVPKEFWRTLTENITSHTFATGEVNTGDCWAEFCPNVSWYASYQEDPKLGLVLDSILNFPVSEVMRPVFGMDCRSADGKDVPFAPFTALQERMDWMRGNFSDLSVLGNFVDNHDTARFLMNRDDPVLLRNNLAFMFGMDGIPIVYYGTEVLMNKGAKELDATPGYYDPANLNRWPLWMWEVTAEAAAMKQWLTKFLTWRRENVRAETSVMVDHFVEDRVYTFLRGSALFVTFNVGKNITELTVEGNMKAPEVWRKDAVETVCDAMAEVQDCLDLAAFEQRFGSTRANGSWSENGFPQVWVPTTRLAVVI